MGNVISRYFLVNLLKLSLIFFLSFSFYFFFFYFLKNAVLNLLNIFSFQRELLDHEFYSIIGLDPSEILAYCFLVFLCLSLTAFFFSYLFTYPFETSCKDLEDYFVNEIKSPTKVNSFIGKIKVLMATRIFLEHLKGEKDSKEKLSKMRDGNLWNPALYLFFILSLSPLFISFLLLIFHLSFNYSSKIVSLSFELNSNKVITHNIVAITDLMYFLSFITAFLFLILLFIFSRYLMNNFVGASYSYIKTLSLFASEEYNHSFHFRKYDPSLSILSRLKFLEKNIKNRSL